MYKLIFWALYLWVDDKAMFSFVPAQSTSILRYDINMHELVFPWLVYCVLKSKSSTFISVTDDNMFFVLLHT